MKVLQLLAGQRVKGESNKSVIACNDYLSMGPGRSQRKLHRRYRAQRDDPENPIEPPVTRLTTINKWSTRYFWVARAEEYDAQIETQRTAHIQQILTTGLAADFERVDLLKRVGDLLIEQLFEEGVDGVLHNLWLPDVKQIGSGQSIERIDIERYNAALIDNIRGVLDDLAKETGGRIQRKDLTTQGDKLQVTLIGNIDHDQI